MDGGIAYRTSLYARHDRLLGVIRSEEMDSQLDECGRSASGSCDIVIVVDAV